jgi:hypothetical protein
VRTYSGPVSPPLFLISGRFFDRSVGSGESTLAQTSGLSRRVLCAGHHLLVEAGTEYVQFSPSNEMHTVSDVMTKNAQALGMG